MNLDLISAAPWVAYLGLAGALASLLRSWGMPKKTKADATKTLVDSATGLVKTLRHECDELEKDLEAAKKTVATLSSSLREAQSEIADLRGQVDRMSKDLSAAHAELAAFRTGEKR